MVHSDVAGFLKLLMLAFARFCCLGVDSAAAMTYGDCARGCEEYSNLCHSMLLSTATFNGFALATVLLFLGVRWLSEERSYRESHGITLIILVAGILLKVVDGILPLVLAARCFTPPYYEGMASAGCGVPCVVGELFAIYALYLCTLRIACRILGEARQHHRPGRCHTGLRAPHPDGQARPESMKAK